jgi:hypothetical protein
MAAIEINTAYQTFYDLEGKPLEGGYVYIGAYGSNPETSAQAIFWDAGLAAPAPNPLRTVLGAATRNGAPSPVFTGSSYSITVRDSARRLIYSENVNESAALEALGVTVTAAQINNAAATTATTAELNILDGATVTFAELNALDGVTAAGTAIIRGADADAQRTSLGLGTAALINTGATGATLMQAADAAAGRTAIGLPSIIGSQIQNFTTQAGVNVTIPAGVTEIRVEDLDLTLSTTASLLCQIGNGTVLTSGYLGGRYTIDDGVVAALSSSTGAASFSSTTAGFFGRRAFNWSRTSGGVWLCDGSVRRVSAGDAISFAQSRVAVSGDVTILRLSVSAGTMTGSFNVTWES